MYYLKLFLYFSYFDISIEYILFFFKYGRKWIPLSLGFGQIWMTLQVLATGFSLISSTTFTTKMISDQFLNSNISVMLCKLDNTSYYV